MLPVRTFIKVESKAPKPVFQAKDLETKTITYKPYRERTDFFLKYTLPLKLAAAKSGRKLKLVAGKAGRKTAGGVVAIVPYYGDAQMIPWFLNYYRKLGVAFFVFLDLSIKNGLAEQLADATDCAVWAAGGFMHPSQTIHALNYLRHRYARNKWSLSVEPYDLLVFPKSETRHINDLIDFVQSEQRNHVYAVVVDAYGDLPARDIELGAGKSPFESLPYFDRFGYQTAEAGQKNATSIYGGVQRRAVYANEPKKAPALNRVPLVFLKPDYYYTASTRQMVPHHLNAPHSEWHSTTTACLLRFALLCDDRALHIAKQAESGQLHADNVTTLYPGSEAMAKMALRTQGSGCFKTSKDLLDCGLLNNGQWF